MDPVRGRQPALPRRRVRAHGDERHPAYAAARLHARTDRRAGRALALAWHRERPRPGWPGGRPAPGCYAGGRPSRVHRGTVMTRITGRPVMITGAASGIG